MSISISGIYSAQSAQSAVTPSPASTTVVKKSPEAKQTSDDSVTLSQSALVSQMNQQGESPSFISQNLGISVSMVDADLGITQSQTQVSVKPAAAPKAQSAAPAQASSSTSIGVPVPKPDPAPIPTPIPTAQGANTTSAVKVATVAASVNTHA